MGLMISFDFEGAERHVRQIEDACLAFERVLVIFRDIVDILRALQGGILGSSRFHLLIEGMLYVNQRF